MTESGRRILQALADGEWWTMAQLAKEIHQCGRKTKAAVSGCQVAGLVIAEVTTYPAQFQITQAGRDALQ